MFTATVSESVVLAHAAGLGLQATSASAVLLPICNKKANNWPTTGATTGATTATNNVYQKLIQHMGQK